MPAHGVSGRSHRGAGPWVPGARDTPGSSVRVPPSRPSCRCAGLLKRGGHTSTAELCAWVTRVPRPRGSTGPSGTGSFGFFSRENSITPGPVPVRACLCTDVRVHVRVHALVQVCSEDEVLKP